ncbi:uncharacterized protein C21orf62 homolog [Erinaceus europaeus]|uniref:Uncharacterized protein C21orf62 homolog n=1 Tax=Erinaceus europaeus TaxID=9365 RepID=A0A1S2ZI85_ERIEU|nr:uncharacterized protein C21orf62 homolog [Erinaceus europaeus]
MAPSAGHSLLLWSLLSILTLGGFSGGQNSTLIFTKDNITHNCSCSTDVRDCEYTLASLLCTCHTVLPLEGQGTSFSHRLTVWFTDASALGLLSNFTLVRDLKLSQCGANPLPPVYLAICGLERLRVAAEAWRPAPEQSLLIREGQDRETRGEPVSPGRKLCRDISFLDVTLFNRDSSLKSYSIENVTSITSDFPELSILDTVSIPNHDSYVVTFIY